MFCRNFICKMCLIITAAAMTFASCEQKSAVYQAEKDLFRARKMKHELSSTTIKGEFLSRTLDTYRGIVRDYGDRPKRSAALDTIIVTAQMEMAQLEFQTGMLDEAYRDFIRAADLSGDLPSAEANAIYSAAVISRELNDTESARKHFSNFYEEFLSSPERPFRITLNRRYILVPLELGHLYMGEGDRDRADKWYDTAEELYSYIIKSGQPQQLVKDAKLNRITAFLQREEWGKARSYLRELKSEVSEAEKMPPLMYLEARIELNGYGNRSEAIRILEDIEKRYPDSEEASSALVTAAGIRFREENYSEARKLCSRLIENYGNRKNEAAEAIWMLARMEEKSGDWLEASLHYRSLYTNYPYTLQGLEAPLKIASHFSDSGENEVAGDAYTNAREHYRNLIRESRSRGARIMAEKYLVRTYTEEGKWEEAVGKLLELVDSYPRYEHFRGNYLRAASICEQKLKDNRRAEEILSICVEKYPGTSLAEEAEKQLDRIRSGK